MNPKTKQFQKLFVRKIFVYSASRFFPVHCTFWKQVLRINLSYLGAIHLYFNKCSDFPNSVYLCNTYADMFSVLERDEIAFPVIADLVIENRSIHQA